MITGILASILRNCRNPSARLSARYPSLRTCSRRSLSPSRYPEPYQWSGDLRNAITDKLIVGDSHTIILLFQNFLEIFYHLSVPLQTLALLLAVNFYACFEVRSLLPLTLSETSAQHICTKRCLKNLNYLGTKRAPARSF